MPLDWAARSSRERSIPFATVGRTDLGPSLMLALGLGWGDGFMGQVDFSSSWLARRKCKMHGCTSLGIISLW